VERDSISLLGTWVLGSVLPGLPQRRLQTLIAALHCSYTQLLPEWLQHMAVEAIQKETEELKWALHR